jgi:hypothetical protein
LWGGDEVRVHNDVDRCPPGDDEEAWDDFMLSRTAKEKVDFISRYGLSVFAKGCRGELGPTTDRKLNALATAMLLAVVSAVYISIGVVIGWAVWGGAG